MTTNDYITITDSQVMVGGKPATTYRGQKILLVGRLTTCFKEIKQIIKQEYGVELTEMHALSSKTPGKHAKTGNPLAKPGRYSWTRCVLADGRKTSWVFHNNCMSSAACASNCASAIEYFVRAYTDYQSALFGSFTSAPKTAEKQITQNAANKSDNITKLKTEIKSSKQKHLSQISLIKRSNSK